MNKKTNSLQSSIQSHNLFFTEIFTFRIRNLPHFLPDNSFKGTVVKRALLSLHEESLEITVPLMFF